MNVIIDMRWNILNIRRNLRIKIQHNVPIISVYLTKLTYFYHRWIRYPLIGSAGVTANDYQWVIPFFP